MNPELEAEIRSFFPQPRRAVRVILLTLSLCGALAIPVHAEEPMVTGLLPVVVTDDVDRLKIFYRDVLGLPLQADEGNYIQFGAGQSHLSIIARDVIGRIAGVRGKLRPGDKGFRFELYFRVADAEAASSKLRKSGAVLVSALSPRPWGDRVAYFLDPDENLVAVADSKP